MAENDKELTKDINTGKEIRLTDNKPKEEDIFSEKDQVNRPLTQEEINEIVKGYSE